MSATVPGIPTGAHIILVREDQVLLMRRRNTRFFDGLFSLPGGHVEPGESARMAASRELGEELGIGVDAADLQLVGAMHRLSDTNRIDFFLRAAHWSGQLRRAEPEKCAELRWCARGRLPSDTVPYIRHALTVQIAEPWLVELGWSPPAG